jgi:hypothetical protein
VGELTAWGVGQHARIVPASEARGLEFDGVVVMNPEEIIAARPGGERDLYVALTRATKRLCTITAHPVPADRVACHSSRSTSPST